MKAQLAKAQADLVVSKNARVDIEKETGQLKAQIGKLKCRAASLGGRESGLEKELADVKIHLGQFQSTASAGLQARDKANGGSQGGATSNSLR